MKKIKLYKIERNLLLAAFALVGFGHHIAGVSLPLEYSTFLIFVVLILQIISGTFKFPKFLFYVLAFIILQTFILNPSNLSDPRVISHFTGLTLLALSTFSFVSYYRDKLYDFVISYYKLVYYIALFSLFQIGIFLLTGFSLIPQNLITGTTIAMGSNVFVPAFLGILPRNIGLSTEPANFAYILIPAVYIGLSQLLKKNSFIKLPKQFVWVILTSTVLTFSLVAYFGILLSVTFILKEHFLRNIKNVIVSIFLVSALIYGIFASGVGNKFIALTNMGKEISENRLETHSYTSFAIISNLTVAIKSQKENHFIGSGLNTHINNYDKYIYQIFKKKQVLLELNKNAAGSVFIRVLSEFGIFGLITFLMLLIHYRINKRGNSARFKELNEMALVTILLYCTRSGHYTGITFLMFIAIYYVTYQMNNTPGNKAENLEIQKT